MATALKVRDVMTTDPACLPDTATLVEAAEQMRDRDIGDVLVIDSEGLLEGIITDRDIVVRALAQGKDASQMHLLDVISGDCVTIGQDQSVADAVQLMREHSVRRLPVTEEGHAVGIVSIGDLAIERDPESALGDISKAPPNQ